MGWLEPAGRGVMCLILAIPQMSGGDNHHHQQCQRFTAVRPEGDVSKVIRTGGDVMEVIRMRLMQLLRCSNCVERKGENNRYLRRQQKEVAEEEEANDPYISSGHISQQILADLIRLTGKLRGRRSM